MDQEMTTRTIHKGEGSKDRLFLAKAISLVNFLLLFLLIILNLLGWTIFASSPSEAVLFVLIIAGLSAMGALITIRRVENLIGWIFCLDALLFLIERSAYCYATAALLLHPSSLPFGELAAWVTNWVGTIAFVLMLTYPLLLFPTGRFLSPNWRYVSWIILLLAPLQVISQMLKPGPLYVFPQNQNPFGIVTLADDLAAIDKIGSSLGGILIGLSAISLVFRYRRSNGIERLQLKWIAFGTAVPVLILFIISIVFPNLGSSAPYLASVMDWLLALSILALPVTITIAILRYRLWDIEIIIRRTLIYGILTLLLAGIYFGGVLLLQESFQMITGTSDSPIAIVISTLLIVLLFNPLRHRIQDSIDKRFYRKKYDAVQAVERFATTARQQADLEQIRTELLRVVTETMQPENVSLWMKPSADDILTDNQLRGEVPSNFANDEVGYTR
jgi:hypothetical protein